MRRGVLAALLSVLVLLLAACTGVPTSSAPRTVDSIDIDDNDDAGAQPGPPRDADPRTIVSRFLDANAFDPVDHATARQYLGGPARRQWADTTATIVGNLTVSTEVNGVITAVGQVVGSLNQNGVYSPQLQSTVQSFSYRVTPLSGQNRITELPSGLVLTTDQFRQAYAQRPLYFFDQARRFLVPDLRWSALQGSRLDAWLVGQLATGPRPDLSSALTSDTIPSQANARRITATAGTLTKVEIPGASQLDTRGKRDLAAQVSATVSDPQSDDAVEITDGGTAVPIPGSGRTFTAQSSAYPFTPVPPAADVFFLRNADNGSTVRQANGKALSGKIGTTAYTLNSIAVAQPAGTSGYTVAAVNGSGVGAQLLLGTDADGYRPTGLRGPMSRPAWAPSSTPGSTAAAEVWVGVAGQIYRVVVTGGRATSITPVSNNANAAGGRIVALRLSPEGARVAVVITGANGVNRLYIGAIVRTGGQVRIDALPAISPDGVSIRDVGWINPQKLQAVGTDLGAKDARIYETNADGSDWSGRTLNGTGLPGTPDSLTVAVRQLAWVSTDATVWKQNARLWTAPVGSTTQGTSPVYLE